MSKKIYKTFLIEDFFHLSPESPTPVVHFELRISPNLLKKFEIPLKAYTWAWEKLIHEKYLNTCVAYAAMQAGLPGMLK
jgi:hypothetical protein